jgi:hypothetical protein
MPRIARLDIPGFLYHGMIRGIERRKAFRDAGDREDFIERLLKPDTSPYQERPTDFGRWRYGELCRQAKGENRKGKGLASEGTDCLTIKDVPKNTPKTTLFDEHTQKNLLGHKLEGCLIPPSLSFNRNVTSVLPITRKRPGRRQHRAQRKHCSRMAC